MKGKLSLALFSAVLFVFAGCGQNNIFSWAHSPGSTSSKSSLTTDASQALQNKDYAKALQYYTQLINANPNDAQAIYGYCSAELAGSGIDIASLVANLVVQNGNGNNSPAYNRLAPALAYAAHAPTSSTSFLPNSIVTNKTAIEKAVNDVLDSKYLLKIIQGKGDGSIAPDNPDVNINIAFCLVLRAALTVNDSNLINFYIDDNGHYIVSLAPGTSASDSSTINTAHVAGRDVISAYHRLLIVAKKLNLGSDAMISKIESDVNTLFTNLGTVVPNNGLDISIDYYATGQN